MKTQGSTWHQDIAQVKSYSEMLKGNDAGSVDGFILNRDIQIKREVFENFLGESYSINLLIYSKR